MARPPERKMLLWQTLHLQAFPWYTSVTLVTLMTLKELQLWQKVWILLWKISLTPQAS